MIKLNKIKNVFNNNKKLFIYCFSVLIFILLVWIILPAKTIYPNNYSKLIYDCNGNLLKAFLTSDEQFRFPPSKDSLPQKYVDCVLAFEDKRFYNHWGVDIFAIFNAMRMNFKAGSIVRGGSTITMQLARLLKPKKRTLINKLFESFTAVKFDFVYSKADILKAYAVHVPMGGNVVGIESAAHRYLRKKLSEITWAEAALLAILPNTPTALNLKKNRINLKKKRDRLLKQLLDENKIDQLTYISAIDETLPSMRPFSPFIAPHAAFYLEKKFEDNTIIKSTIDRDVQEISEVVAKQYYGKLKSQGIMNYGVLIADTKTGEVKAYIGSQGYYDTVNSGMIDAVHSPRSTGSVLKPFLGALLIGEGPYTAKTMLKDIPTYFGTFCPQNATKEFSGLVSLEDVLIRSLNVPSARMLNTYGVERFYGFLKEAGLSNLFRTADGYGLSLILGGAEASMWDLTQLYLILANKGKVKKLRIEQTGEDATKPKKIMSDAASWIILNTLTKLSRPGIEDYWNEFNSSPMVSWKTGTSYGQKDAWAIGTNPQWTIAVWTGNFNGMGNAAIAGSKTSAPLLFILFNLLTKQYDEEWFSRPEYNLTEIACCKLSGYPIGAHCPDTLKELVPLRRSRTGVCPYHKRFIISKSSKKTVCSLCWDISDTAWKVMPSYSAAVIEELNKKGYSVEKTPNHTPSCRSVRNSNSIEIIYPIHNIKIFVPRDIDGEYENVVFKAKHNRKESNLYWYLNERFIGTTMNKHDLACSLKPGDYKLTLQDEEGSSNSVTFKVFRREKKDKT